MNQTFFKSGLITAFSLIIMEGVAQVTTTLLYPCPATITQTNFIPRSSMVYNAIFYVNTNGEVISRPQVPIDANDIVTVNVIGTTTQLLSLKVERKSPFGDASTIELLGASPLNSRGNNGDTTLTCALKKVELGNFKPGQGVAQISPIDESDTFKGGSFDFEVNPLYSGSLSFGPVYSWLTSRSYGIASNGQHDIITVKERTSPRIHYLITYTHFAWGKRDVEKSKSLRFYEHLNPMIGLTLNDVLNNGFLGLSLDMLGHGIYLQGGIHAGQVTTIDPNSGLGVGSAFTMGADKIPTIKQWNSDWFLGATIDLRVAIHFFSAAASGVGTIK